MSHFYPTLAIEPGQCPPGCSDCATACLARPGGAGPAIKPFVTSKGFSAALACGQCGQPLCRSACPTGAISRSSGDGIVRVNPDKCVACGLCTVACPYAGIYLDGSAPAANKCDLCDGDPRCQPACKHGVLSFHQPDRTAGYFRGEDRMGYGTFMCPGCPSELGLRFAMRILGGNTILFGAPGCGTSAVRENPVPHHIGLMTNAASTMEGVKRYYQRLGREVNVVGYVGDGATADIGLQTLSGAAERGASIIYICYDNEAYMNTGIQRSSTTPPMAWTFTTPVGAGERGKAQASKYVPLIMAMHDIPYVATAALSHLEDYARKLSRAMEIKRGLVYIHLLTPCPVGWRAPAESGIELCKMAVETNYFPLWEAENGKFAITHRVARPRPVKEFTRLMGRFGHLTDAELEEFQEMVNRRFTFIENLAGITGVPACEPLS